MIITALSQHHHSITCVDALAQFSLSLVRSQLSAAHLLTAVSQVRLKARAMGRGGERRRRSGAWGDEDAPYQDPTFHAARWMRHGHGALSAIWCFGRNDLNTDI